MTNGFQHQNQQANFTFPKSAPSPQHGQKPDKSAAKAKEGRSFQPRPGHG
jgi:hypothetical protein